MRMSCLPRLAAQAKLSQASVRNTVLPSLPFTTTASNASRLLSHKFATSSLRAMATQQGQNFSQLKDAKDEQTEVVFNPQEQGAADMAQVDQAKLNSPDPKESLARVWFAADCEAAINEQINHEYTMSYVYHAAASYFNRDNVSLPGFRDFFKAASMEERGHAQQLMDYQATRGGRVKLAAIKEPNMDYSHDDKGDALFAMETALAMERLNLQYLYNLHGVAEKANDGQMADFVEVMLEEQVNGVKEAADYVAKLRRVGKGLGVYQFDAELGARVGSADAAPEAGAQAA